MQIEALKSNNCFYAISGAHSFSRRKVSTSSFTRIAKSNWNFVQISQGHKIDQYLHSTILLNEYHFLSFQGNACLVYSYTWCLSNNGNFTFFTCNKCWFLVREEDAFHKSYIAQFYLIKIPI